MVYCVGRWFGKAVFVYNEETKLYTLKLGYSSDYQCKSGGVGSIYKLGMLLGLDLRNDNYKRIPLYEFLSRLGLVMSLNLDVIPIDRCFSHKDMIYDIAEEFSYGMDSIFILSVSSGTLSFDTLASKYVDSMWFIRPSQPNELIYGVVIPPCIVSQVVWRASNHDLDGLLNDFDGAFSENLWAFDGACVGRGINPKLNRYFMG